MNQALQTPELLTRILTIVHDDGVSVRRSPLTHLARVNSLWREIVQRIIWTAPPAEALANIARSRRQLFASYIKHLHFGGGGGRDPTLHTLFANLEFPRLRGLALSNLPVEVLNHQNMGPLVGWGLTVSQYLQPTLEGLEVLSWDSICTASFFEQISDRCPQLKRIHLSGIGAHLQPDDFLSFFKASCRLETIKLNLGQNFLKGVLVTGELLLHLSRMAKLIYLELNNPLNQPEFFEIIRDQNSTPFTNLTKVVLTVSALLLCSLFRACFP